MSEHVQVMLTERTDTVAAGPYEELLDHLTRSTTLSRPEAQRVVQEVLVFFGEPVERFVKRRHGELQRSGFANPVIFEQIRRELPFRRVAAPGLTVRQIRRIIYG
jgi:predicted acylesterase/phospholipase RssA